MKYEITDVTRFVNGSRVFVYKNFSGLSQEEPPTKPISYEFNIKTLTLEEVAELETCLNTKEATLIFNEYASKKDDALYMTETEYMDYLAALTSRMTSNLLKSLANKNLLNIAFDEEKNDFVFWPNEQDTKDTEEET